MNVKIRPIRYFSPTGEGMPNGCHYQRGGFLIACYRNAQSFITMGIADVDGTLVGSCGGILVFPLSWRGDEKVVQGIADEFSILHAIAHAFGGRYRDPETGEEFGADSMTIEVGRMDSRELRRLATRLADAFVPQTILMKDLNDNRIYRVVGERSASDSGSGVLPLPTQSKFVLALPSKIVYTCHQLLGIS